jgi:hypothetical protein
MPPDILTEALSGSPQKTLYHYTTQVGLLGIVTGKEIWATHTQYLNDQREYRHAIDLVAIEIDRRTHDESDGDTQTILWKMVEGLEGIESTNVCVCSFSEDQDSLSQWRAYGGSTSGYAIGFNPKFLATIVKRERFYLAPCLYDPKLQEGIVRALVQEVLDENLERKRGGEWPILPPGGNLTAYLHRYAPILKDSSFAQEKEWRIISRPLMCTQAQFGYRHGHSTLIPYYRIPLSGRHHEMRIDEVVIGPTPHSKLACAAVKSLLVRHAIKSAEVTPSKVPYRNW